MKFDSNTLHISGIGFFAVSDSDPNTIKSIFEVPTGKECGCICPECKKPVVAKNRDFAGRKYCFHFAHQHESSEKKFNSTCSPESALHALAKSIIKNRKIVEVPVLSPIIPQLSEFMELESLIKNQKSHFSFDLAIEELELKDQGIRPDLACYLLEKPNAPVLFIEITVTNSLNAQKIEKYKKMRTDVLEINLSGLYKNGRKISSDDLCNEVITNTSNRKFIQCLLRDRIDDALHQHRVKSIAKPVDAHGRYLFHEKKGKIIKGKPYYNYSINKLCVLTSEFSEISACGYAIIKGDCERRFLKYIWELEWEGTVENGIPVLTQRSYLV